MEIIMSKNKKPDLFDLFNDESLWGNQETDSLSHDDIMNKNWNQITANREIARRPEVRAKVDAATRKRAKDPAWRKKRSELSKKVWENEEFYNKMKEYYNTPEYKEYISKRSKKIAKRDYDKIVKRIHDQAKDPVWLKANAKAQANRSKNNEEWIRKNCRPVSTPYGVFMRAKEAIEAYCAEHPNERYESVNLKLRRWYKSNQKPDWYYLTWEEYDAKKD